MKGIKEMKNDSKKSLKLVTKYRLVKFNGKTIKDNFKSEKEVLKYINASLKLNWEEDGYPSLKSAMEHYPFYCERVESYSEFVYE